MASLIYAKVLYIIIEMAVVSDKSLRFFKYYIVFLGKSNENKNP